MTSISRLLLESAVMLRTSGLGQPTPSANDTMLFLQLLLRSFPARFAPKFASLSATAMLHPVIPQSLSFWHVCAGEQIGSSLVEAKLAACVNVVPGITSIYW